MTVDTGGNTLIKKDFWADGGWHGAFILAPLFIGWLALAFLLSYGAYATFTSDALHLKAGTFFALFAMLAIIGIIPFAKSLFALLTERVIFTDKNFVYKGFGSYSLPYNVIKRFSLYERGGPFGREKFLVVYARDEFDRERLFIIPRWKTLSGGVLAQEFSKRMTLSLLDRGLLSYYVSSSGREWWLPAILSSAALAGIFFFFIARAYPQDMAGVTVALWLALSCGLIFFLARYAGRKKYVTSRT